MLSLKILTFLFLALAVLGLNLQSSHDSHPSSVIFQNENYTLPQAPFYQWSDFPGLAGEFQVGQRSVEIAYSIQTYSPNVDFLVARLFIDGVEDRRFRSISGGSLYKSLFINLPVQLSEGTHSVKLQFRSSGPVKNIIIDDWKQAYVQINYV